MAFDRKGKYHMNPIHARTTDGEKPAHKPMGTAKELPNEPDGDGEEDGGEGTAVLPKEDGSVHTHGHDGEHNEHESMHHALAHVAEKHGHPDLAEHIMQHHTETQGAEPEMAMHSSGGMGGY